MRDVVYILVLITSFSSFFCAEEEVPNLCGLYGGSIYTYTGGSATFYIDIMRCDAESVSGETEWLNRYSYIVKSFEGSWSESGDDINISVQEEEILAQTGTPDFQKYNIRGTISGDTLKGNCYRVERYEGTFTLNRLEATILK